MTALQYIYKNLDEDFPAEAPALKGHIARQMKELGYEEPSSTKWEQEDLLFQLQLNTVVYPFLSCVKALVRQGTERALAISYASRLWKEIPEEIRNMANEEELEALDQLFQYR